MYYGHASWVVLVPLAIVLLMRLLGSRRGRPVRGRPGMPPSARSFAAPRLPPPAPSPGAAPGASGTPAGWFVDPFARHDQRYWSGTVWTEHVTDGGVPASDPPPAPPGPAG